jgi:hypothetical protein
MQHISRATLQEVDSLLFNCILKRQSHISPLQHLLHTLKILFIPNGLPKLNVRGNECRPLKALQQRQGRAPAIHRERRSEGADPAMYVSPPCLLAQKHYYLFKTSHVKTIMFLKFHFSHSHSFPHNEEQQQKLTINSGTLPNRRLLEEMRDGHDPQRETGKGRGIVHGELRGSVYGCEFHGH